MGCAKTLSGMGLDCRESVGGIKEVYILGDRNDITFPITFPTLGLSVNMAIMIC